MKRLADILMLLSATAVSLVWTLRPAGQPTLAAGTEHHLVTVRLDAARAGDRDIAVTVTDRAGNPERARAVQLMAVLPTRGHAGPAQTATATGPGTYRAQSVHLMAPGAWQLVVTLAGAAPDRIVIPFVVTA